MFVAIFVEALPLLTEGDEPAGSVLAGQLAAFHGELKQRCAKFGGGIDAAIGPRALLRCPTLDDAIDFVTDLYHAIHPFGLTLRAAATESTLGGSDPWAVQAKLDEILGNTGPGRMVCDKPGDKKRNGFSLGEAPTAASIDNGPSCIGRGEFLSRVAKAVHHSRVVNLTGMAECGKSTIAAAVSESFRHLGEAPVWVSMRQHFDEDRLPNMIRSAIGLEIPNRSRNDDNLDDLIAENLQLVVLDGCDRDDIVNGLEMERLLAACPHLRLLVTSRRQVAYSLAIRLQVPPLEVPSENETEVTALTANPSVQVFVRHAAKAHRGFRLKGTNAAAIAELCRESCGHPGTLAYLASKVPQQSPDDLASALKSNRLEELFDAMRHAGRHHQGWLALDEHYEQLPEAARELYRMLWPISGSFTIDIARAFTGPLISIREAIDALLDAGVLQPEGSRYRFPPIVKAHGQARCLREGIDAFEDAILRHARAYLGLLESLTQPANIRREKESFEILDADEVNLWQAFETLLDARHTPGSLVYEDSLAVRFAVAVTPYFLTRGYHERLDSHLKDAIELPAMRNRYWVEVRGLFGILERLAGRLESARSKTTEALEAALEQGDLGLTGLCHNLLASVSLEEGLLTEALEQCGQSEWLMRVSGDTYNLPYVQLNEAMATTDLAMSEALFLEAEEGMLASNNLRGLAQVLASFVDRLLEAKSYVRASVVLLRLCELCQENRYRHMLQLAMRQGALLASRLGDAGTSARLLGASDKALMATARSETPQQSAKRDQLERTLRIQLGVEFRRLYALGQRGTLDEALQFAIETLQAKRSVKHRDKM